MGEHWSRCPERTIRPWVIPEPHLDPEQPAPALKLPLHGLHCAAPPRPFQHNLSCCFHNPASLWAGSIWNTASFASEHSPEVNLERWRITSAFRSRLACYKVHIRENALFHGVYLFRANLILCAFLWTLGKNWVEFGSFQCSSQRLTALPCYRSAVPRQAGGPNVNVLPCAQTPQKKNIFFTISVTLSLLFLLRGNSTVSVVAWSENSHYFNPPNSFVWHLFLIKHVTYMAC